MGRCGAVSKQKPMANVEAAKVLMALLTGTLFGLLGSDDETPFVGHFSYDNLAAGWILGALLPLTVHVTSSWQRWIPINKDTVTVRILNSAPAQFLGKVSFSLHATHLAVHIPLAQRTKWLGPSVGMVFAAVSCLVVAWTFHHLVE
jgi:peptidoglycan/LPS O-acetylase OafA/YrhL